MLLAGLVQDAVHLILVGGEAAAFLKGFEDLAMIDEFVGIEGLDVVHGVSPFRRCGREIRWMRGAPPGLCRTKKGALPMQEGARNADELMSG
jgi:hypothetical protein